MSIVIAKDLSKIQWPSGFSPAAHGGGLNPPSDAPSGFPMGAELEYTDEDHQKVKIGGGSGFIVSADGVVLTNRHVVADPDAEYTVVMQDGTKVGCEILVRDSINDLAILRIPVARGKKLPTVKLGDSTRLQLGQTSVAIGNALGEFANTVSVGVISGLSRFITAHDSVSEENRRLRGLIQTDAAINPGNSGGPLLDIFGQVIGINSAAIFGASSIGFAVPVNAAKKDLAQLKKFGHLRQASLGVRYILLNKELQRIGTLASDKGALIIREQGPNGEAVVKGSCADKAGLKENDIIVKFNGTLVTENNRLDDLVCACEVGDVANLTVLRKGKELNIRVTLTERV